MDRLAQSFTSTEIRAVIKFFVLEGMPTKDVHSRLVKSLKESAPSYETVRRWMWSFESGRVETEDEARSGRPSSATNDHFVQQVQQLLEEDRRMTCPQMADRIGISKDSVHQILTEKLLKQKIVAKWVPHL